MKRRVIIFALMTAFLGLVPWTHAAPGNGNGKDVVTQSTYIADLATRLGLKALIMQSRVDGESRAVTIDEMITALTMKGIKPTGGWDPAATLTDAVVVQTLVQAMGKEGEVDEDTSYEDILKAAAGTDKVDRLSETPIQGEYEPLIKSLDFDLDRDYDDGDDTFIDKPDEEEEDEITQPVIPVATPD